MPIRYYKLRGSRISLREYWRLCPDPFTFCIAAVAKPFGGVAPALSVPLLDRIPDVHPDDLPKGVARALDRQAERFEAEGYRRLFTCSPPLLEPNRVNAAAVLLSEDGWSMAQVLYIRNGEMTQVGLTVGCWCDDGTFAVVTSRKQELDSPPGHRVERYLGAGVGELVEKFLRHARAWDTEGMRATPLDEAKVRANLVRVERESIEFQVGRGVLVPLTPRDLAKHGVEAED
jgi:hypothetical protein